MTTPILIEVFNEWDEGKGIFDKLMSLTFMPWGDEYPAITSEILDFEYFANHSGGKFCSPIVRRLLTDGVLTDSSREKLASIIVAKYLIPWNRLWLTNAVEYSPVNNYDATETRTLMAFEDESTTTDRDETHTGTDTLTHGLVNETEHAKTMDEIDYRYGMNNTVLREKPSDEYTSAEGGTTTVSQTGDDVQTKDLANTEDTTVTRGNDRSETEVTHKIGNIGVTTNQKLVQDERELWKWNFFEQVFSDIDKELALAVSDPCRV